MWLSYHPKIKGKPVCKPNLQGKPVYYCDNQIVNLGWGWENHCCDDLREAFDIVTVLGLATSSRLSNNHRCEDNFVSRQLCMVDIDSGMSIDELLQDVFYQECALGYYATSSHTEQHHRFRIVFATEDAIDNREHMRNIISGLLSIYLAADTNCRDSTRIYYGVPNSTRYQYLGNRLSREIIDELALIPITKQTPKIEYQTTTTQELDAIAIEKLLEMIAQQVGNLRGDYMVWRTIAWAVCSSTNITTAEYLMKKFWYEKTQREITTLRAWKPNREGPGIGTLIKLSNISKLDRRLLELESQKRKLCQEKQYESKTKQR
jgi:hypothetical protein